MKKIDQSQFEQLVVDALFGCAIMHLEAPRRKRFREIRKVLRRVEKEAVAAEKHLEGLRDALAKLEHEHRERLDRRLDLLSKIAGLVEKRPPSFYALSSVGSMAGYEADELYGKKDRGGAPNMVVFSMLIRGLSRAFEKATGRRAAVTWRPDRDEFEGKFLNLVEAILPLALAVACHSEGPMPHPESAYARAKYIHKLTKNKREATNIAIPKT